MGMIKRRQNIHRVMFLEASGALFVCFIRACVFFIVSSVSQRLRVGRSLSVLLTNESRFRSTLANYERITTQNASFLSLHQTLSADFARLFKLI